MWRANFRLAFERETRTAHGGRPEKPQPAVALRCVARGRIPSRQPPWTPLKLKCGKAAPGAPRARFDDDWLSRRGTIRNNAAQAQRETPHFRIAGKKNQRTASNSGKCSRNCAT